ncbi:MAG: hypothetical protein JXO44_01895 [Clostridia bacterium]|nr:hypothetical protein [Clostridia bacterium]
MSQLFQTKATPEVIQYLHTKGIIAYNLLGAIEHIADLQLYTDNPENPTGILGKEDYFMYIVTESLTFVDWVLETFCHKDGYYGFSGLRQDLADYILEKGLTLDWRNDCYLYYLPDTVSLPAADPRVESIPLDAAEEINTYYEYQHEESLAEIQEDLLKRPSSCITINGERASWALVHRDNTMGIMYTKEAYRQQQLAVLVCNDLMHKVRQLGKIPYVQILTSNTPSQRLAAKVGMVQAEAVVAWFGIIKGNV